MRNYFLAFEVGGLLLLCCCGGASAPSTPPNLQLSPATLSFGVQPVGTESAAQTETLANTGGSDLDISSASPSPAPMLPISRRAAPVVRPSTREPAAPLT